MMVEGGKYFAVIPSLILLLVTIGEGVNQILLGTPKILGLALFLRLPIVGV